MSNKTKLVPKLQSAWSPIVRTEPLTLEEIEIQNTLQNLYKNTEDLRNGDYDRLQMQIKQEQEQAKKDKRRQAFSNAMLTINMGENAPVAIASGYGYDENGNIGLYYINDPGVEALRNNLAVLGATTLAAPAAGYMGSEAIAMGWPWWRNFIGEAATGMAGGIATDAVYRGLTGKSWAQGVRDMLPEGPAWIPDETKTMLADMTNPGGWLSFGMARQIGNGINQILNKTFKLPVIDKDYTKRLLKLLETEKETPLRTSRYIEYIDSFKTYLKGFGVDLSKFTNRDLARLMALREKSVLSTLPNEKSITVKVATSPKNNIYYGLNLYNSDGQRLGVMDLSGKVNKSLNVGEIYSDNVEKGISYPLYDAGIRLSNGEGIISGETLLSPEQTYAVWNKYPNKLVISHTGEHNFNSGRNVHKTGARTTITYGPVVKLETPIGEELPMKSITFFHPGMIDHKTGKLNPPDWSSKDIFRATIPFGLPFLLNLNYE